MRKLIAVVFVVSCLLWVWGCDRTQSITPKPGISNNASQRGVSYKSMHAYIVVPEGGNKVVNVFDSLTKETILPDGIIGKRVSILTGDADNVYRIVDITTEEKSHFDILIKGKKNSNIEVAVDIQGDLMDVSQDKEMVWLDKNGDGFIKIYLDPANRKYWYKFSMEGQ